MRFVIPVLAMSVLAGQAMAQTPPPAPTPPTVTTPAAPTSPARTTALRRFEAANTTHDGHLTKEQAQAAHMVMTVRHFDAIDKDHKGYVTIEDLSAYAAAQRAQRGAATKPPG
jgi:hypothetical protein